MSTILVQVTDNSSGQTTSGLVLNHGDTVRAALASVGVSGDNFTIRVNRQQAGMETVLNDGDSVSFTRTDLKGAGDDVLNFTFEDILNAGTGPVNQDAGAFGKAVAEYSERAREVHKEVISEMLASARATAPEVNRGVVAAEENLAKANDRKARFAYCMDQLRANNPFALMSFLGQKQDAARVCNRLGCSVPPSNSPLWNTSANA